MDSKGPEKRIRFEVTTYFQSLGGAVTIVTLTGKSNLHVLDSLYVGAPSILK
jgi:hypothetical protein